MPEKPLFFSRSADFLTATIFSKTKIFSTEWKVKLSIRFDGAEVGPTYATGVGPSAVDL